MKEQWLGSKETWDKILAMGLTWQQWKPGDMGTDTFYIETDKGTEKVNVGDWIIKDEHGFKRTDKDD